MAQPVEDPWMRGFFLALAAICVAIPGLLAEPAFAQRPSLEGLQQQIDTLEDALCTRVDADNDQLRPLFCDATCSCPLSTSYPVGTTCNEVTPGDYEVSAGIPFSATCNGVCSGGSGGICTDTFQCPAGETCQLNTCQVPPDPCATSADCTLGTCGFQSLVPGTCSVAGTPCLVATQCPGFLSGETCSSTPVDAGLCIEDGGSGPKSCTQDADCLAGYTCQNTLVGLVCLGPTACSAAGTCDSGSIPTTFDTLQDVAPPGSSQLASCNGAPINSNDVNVCLQQVEAELGAACVTLP